MTVHLEAVYGFYHGQDPRTFSPDRESCSAKELEAHRLACEAAGKGEWVRDGSGCHVKADGVMVHKTSMGLGVYYAVVSEDGDFLRDAAFEDLSRGESWEE